MTRDLAGYTMGCRLVPCHEQEKGLGDGEGALQFLSTANAGGGREGCVNNGWRSVSANHICYEEPSDWNL